MEITTKKPLSHVQMALATGLAIAAGALPVYLAVWKSNVLPCLVLFIAAKAYLVLRRRMSTTWNTP
ncbi:hypothetical protein PHO31112_04303 [Pandoraea horticolens]|uniref:Uncharacterized protein n=1 Tax=Pandoraea horticolens TaxID=2508298 RepID=A0A5E4Y5Q8_9BURK|nr:hypothetical protein PHO31112_04303 [Pandoraea horticolens]